MSIVDRVKNILMSPKTEWPVIAGEATTTQALYTGYIMILAAIGPVALLLRSMGLGIVGAIVAFIVALAAPYIMALIVDALAPTFGGEKNFMQSLKLTAYSYTAVWIAGILHLLGALGGLLSLLAAIYALYTFYLGVPVMKKCPQEKAVAYTLVVVVCGIVLTALVGSLLMSTMFGGMGM
jgi:hypothetical protein